MNLRREAILMLENSGAVLETARKVSRLLTEGGVPGAIIGGIAVFLHGYARTTRDVDVLAPGNLAAFGRLLEQAGAKFDRARKEYVLDGVPVHLVAREMAVPAPGEPVEID